MERTTKGILALAVAAGVLYGFGVGPIVAVAMPYLERTGSFSAVRLSALVAAAMLGSAVMTPFAGKYVECVGRVRAIRQSAIAFALGSPILCLSGGAFPVLFCGVLLQGVALGVQGLVLPLYLAEMLPKEIRGRGTALYQLFLISGILLSGLLGLGAAHLFGPADDPSVALTVKTTAWQALFAVEALPALVLLVGSFFLKESPYWRKLSSAKADGTAGADAAPVARDSVWQRKYILPFVLVAVILSCNKGVGVDSILGYSVKIFLSAGLDGVYANWADLGFKLVMFVMTVLACVSVERRGRRFLLVVGTAGCVVGLLVASSAFFAVRLGWLETSHLSGWIVAGGITLLVAAYAFGPGVCIWLVLTELLPGRIRAVGMGLALIFDNGVSTGLGAAYLPLVERIGYDRLFLALAGAAVAYFVTVALFMPETKGKTLEEIEEHFR